MKHTTKLIVSRKWHNPVIETYITHEEIGSRIDLTDAITAIVQHIGNPTLLMTKSGLRSKIEQAIEDVLHEMKGATVHVA